MSRFQARLDATNSTSTPMRLVFGLRVPAAHHPIRKQNPMRGNGVIAVGRMVGPWPV
jgi:hypothetical protein